MNDTKFAVTNYEGITVSCTTDQWDNHIIDHAEMVGNVKAVKDTIKDPDTVYKSNQNVEREVYFKKTDVASYAPLLTKVIVEYGPGKNNPDAIVGDVVTAFPTKKEKGGIADVVYKRQSED